MEDIIELLKTDYYNEADGDKIITKELEDGTVYAYVSSNKRGFGSMYIAKDLTFLFFASAVNPEEAYKEFKNGRRSQMPN